MSHKSKCRYGKVRNVVPNRLGFNMGVGLCLTMGGCEPELVEDSSGSTNPYPVPFFSVVSHSSNVVQT